MGFFSKKLVLFENFIVIPGKDIDLPFAYLVGFMS